MEKDQIIKIISEWQNKILRTQGIEREYDISLLASIGSRSIKMVTGFRKSGKSFLVQRVAKKLVEDQTYSISKILYLNFEDFKLAGINTPDKLDNIYDHHGKRQVFIY